MVKKILLFRCGAWPVALLLLTAGCNYQLPFHPVQFVTPRLSVPLTSRDMIRDFLGLSHYSFKLAFTRKADQSIYVVDFSRIETDNDGQHVSPKVYRFKAEGIPDSPLFSPDGEWITYFVRLDATVQKSYVRKISDNSTSIEVAAQGTDPHFWEDSSGRLYVVYSDRYQVNLNELPVITGYATYRQEINGETGALTGDRQDLLDMPFNGGLSKDGRYLSTGYSDGAFYDLKNDVLHRVNYDATLGGMQICNASISPDSVHTDWMLFLPFVGAQKLDYSGVETSPGMVKKHEYLFVVDKENKVRWQRAFPDGYYQWQDPEWTNEFNFIVALAKVVSNENDTRHDCFLIRQSDKAVIRLTTDEFRLDGSATPAFWIAKGE
jgi:hypothetical protein